MRKTLLMSLPLFMGGTLMAQEESKPNIIFLFADDMTFQALGSTSDGEVKTPNLDRLKSQGTCFTHTFNQGGFNGAISVASRAMMNTGKYLWKAMDETNGKVYFNPRELSWPDDVPIYEAQVPEHPSPLWSEYMRDAGYETYITGKWHVPTDPKKVFDHVRHIRAGMPRDTKEAYERKFIQGEEDEWNPTDMKFQGYWQGGKHWSEVLRDDALDYIDHASKIDKPFFMYLAFNAPHDPRQAPQEYQDMYDVNKIKVPETFMPIYPYCEEIASGRFMRDERLAPHPRTEYSVQVNRKEYYALISHLDTQIGMILDALEKSGKMDNTYTFFTADHGLAVGDHGFIGKQNVYDPSIRVPMFVAGPGIAKGKQLDNMVYLQDVMATCLDLAGSEGLNKVDFQSFLPLLKGKKMKTRDAMINCYAGSQRMIRTDRYKMIIYPRVNVVRLFDLKNDPNEMVDLAVQKKYVKLMNKLFDKFQKLQKEVKDPLDIKPYYDEYMKQTFN